nr:putative ribonuclease H-like domain-containing protein [Tanacetum cinerariifolium]
KRIKREFSVPRTPQQNGIAERKNRTLIEAARTMLADSQLPIPFWAESVNTACYVQNKVDEGFLIGYSVNSKAFRLFNSRTRFVQETLHVNFLENKPNIAGTGLTWLFDIDSLTRTMNYQPFTVGNQSNPSVGFQGKFDAEKAGEDANQQYMLFPVWSTGSLNPQNKEGDVAFDGKEHDAEKPGSTVNLSLSSSALLGEQDDMSKKKDKGKSPVEYFTGNRDLNADFEDFSEDSGNDVSVVGPIVPTAGQNYSNSTNPFSATKMEDIAYFDHENEPKRVHQALKDPSKIKAMQEELLQFKMQKVWILVGLPHGKRSIGFEDPDHPNKVYKVVKALYGLHQAPKAWYETLANYLLENGFHRGQIDQTLFIKKQKRDILLV